MGLPFDKPDILLVLPTYGHFDYARRCASSFIQHTANYRTAIAIIDDCSNGWDEIEWAKWPVCNQYRIHYTTHEGLTRSWNKGLGIAAIIGAEYTICGNSDTVFTPFCLDGLIEALKSVDLVGPVTNAPGHCEIQRAVYMDKSDEDWCLGRYANMIRNNTLCVETDRINGFFLMAKTETWWKYRFDDKHVFDPRYKLTGNEDELQKRWKQQGAKIGYCPRSFIFHYRGISRELPLTRTEDLGAFRPEPKTADDRSVYQI